MIAVLPTLVIPDAALRWSYSRSSGPGGQNVQKTETKVELRLHVPSAGLPDDVADRLLKLAGTRRTEADEIVLRSDRHRERPRNEADCAARLKALVLKALEAPRPRRATRPSRASVQRRLDAKRRRSDALRRRRGD